MAGAGSSVLLGYTVRGWGVTDEAVREVGTRR